MIIVKREKAKGTKQCVIKRILKFHEYKYCLLNIRIILKSHQRFKSDYDNVYTAQINKTALSSNNEKILQTFDKIPTYPYKTNAFKVSEYEMQSKYNALISMIMQMKTEQIIIQSGRIFQIAHTEY